MMVGHDEKFLACVFEGLEVLPEFGLSDYELLRVAEEIRVYPPVVAHQFYVVFVSPVLPLPGLNFFQVE